ncbi:hypothetical protein NUW58_g1320 [Xylaria curta]|uniref:Uncharacterized protein n=1 Tax=Xylaria curta TaxID=42375 RepID=A0ACC1PKS9_9PEZI|nr:hypothetical protein NUW58_g1320 [Xylaria curta]
MGDEVLLIPGHCGVIDQNALQFDEVQLLSAERTKKITSASNYGQQCYANGSGKLDCAVFVATRLPTLINNNASCPFHPEICTQDNSSLYLSTGLIDTNTFFGMNSPENERVLFNASLHCSPLATKGYTSSRRSMFRNYTRYHYGVEIPSPNRGKQAQTGVAFEVEDVETQYQLNEPPLADQYWPWRTFQVDILYTTMYNGSIQDHATIFAPIDRLLRYDGDTTLVFLRGNGVLFSDGSTDAWYKATRPMYKVQTFPSNGSMVVYGMNESASPLVCFQQFQFCHTGLPEDARCGVVGSMLDAAASALTPSASSKTQTQILWVYEQLASKTRISDQLQVLGSEALASRLTRGGGVQGQIADNQWQLDVIQWWATYLAEAQAVFVDSTVGPADPRLQEYVQPLKNDYDEKTITNICKNQKIRSGNYVSFSVFGICAVFLSGGLIILVSVLLEPILSYFHHEKKYKQYAYLEWVTNETLQLHRLAHEEAGWGTWSNATETIPTTKEGELLAPLDLEDLSHPKLRRPLVNPENTESSISGYDNRASMSRDNRPNVPYQPSPHHEERRELNSMLISNNGYTAEWLPEVICDTHIGEITPKTVEEIPASELEA